MKIGGKQIKLNHVFYVLFILIFAVILYVTDIFGKLTEIPEKKYSVQDIKTINVVYTGGGAGINDVYRIDFEKNTAHYYDNRKKAMVSESEFSDDRGKDFLRELERCELLKWKKSYGKSGEVNDGIDWTVTVEFKSGKPFVSLGYNERPPEFNDFFNAVKALTNG